MTNSYTTAGSRILLSTLFVLLCAFVGTAQLAPNYSLGVTSGSYSSISGTGTAVAILGDDLSLNITGLSPGFTVNGVTYTNARMNSNGWLALYVTTAPTTNTSYAPLSTAMTNGAVIFAPFGRDQNGTGAAAWRQTIGNEHIFEWQNFYRYGTTGESLNYQVRLNTATGEVVFMYGSCTASTNTTYPQVGWKTTGTTAGNWSTDVNNLNIDATGSPNTCDWSNAVTGQANNSTCYFNSTNATVKPNSGLTFTWTPHTTPAPVRTYSAVSGITATGATLTWTAPTGATTYNVQYRAVGSCSWTNHPGNPVATNTATLSGLSPLTVYQIRVQSNDGTNLAIFSHVPNQAGSGTGYSATGTFTTLALPPVISTTAPSATNYCANAGQSIVITGQIGRASCRERV